MPFTFTFLSLLGLLGLVQLPQPEPRFPTVTSDNLEGRTFTLPRDFEGERNIVFVAFLREHQNDVDTWVPLVKKLVAEHPGTSYYELPTLKRGVALWRWSLNKGMKMGIPDRAAREHTITLYLEKEPFRAALGIPDEKSIHVLVVDREGRVLWRTTGRWNEQEGAALAAALADRQRS
jgi:hypothetical protein